MTIKEYLERPRATTRTSKIVGIIPGDQVIVRLDRTLFHAQGGGQKADRGRIGTAHVVHVVHNRDDVDHHVDSADGLAVGQEVAIEIDAEWRKLNAAFHSGGHHLASVVEAMYPGLKAISGHQWPGEARVEFEGDVSVESLSLEEINARMRADVDAALPVMIEGDPYTSRSIKIGDYPSIPCGGTHVSSLSEITFVAVQAVKQKRGRIRASYEVGAT